MSLRRHPTLKAGAARTRLKSQWFPRSHPKLKAGPTRTRLKRKWSIRSLPKLTAGPARTIPGGYPRDSGQLKDLDLVGIQRLSHEVIEGDWHLDHVVRAATEWVRRRGGRSVEVRLPPPQHKSQSVIRLGWSLGHWMVIGSLDGH